MDIQFPYSIIFLLPIFLLVVLSLIYSKKSGKPRPFLKSYPLIGSSLQIIKNRHNIIIWISEIFQKSSSTSTITLQGPLGLNVIFTINPSNVQHILKTRFNIYGKESSLKEALSDFFGYNGLFLIDGKEWKCQRQFLGHDFNLKGFQNFVQSVTEKEMSNRLLPFLKSAAAMNKSTLDLQETFRRLTYDLVCQIGFSYDLQYLLPSLPPTPFADAYETALKISMGRYTTVPFIWKVKKKLNTKSQKTLKHVVDEIQEFMGKRIKEKKEKLVNNNRTWIDDHDDLFDRIMRRGKDKLQLDEAYYVDAAINFILAGQDTLCSALTWFFWLVSTNPSVEIEIVKEIKEKDDWREMVYTHASICESMRLYPPVPVEGKQAAEDDVWPDGTKVKKGTRVCFHILAMGRSEELWGSNWADFRPERWLDKSVETGECRFIARDPFTYPVFLAGPRACLGKQVAFFQMKMVASTILKHFRVIPSMEDFVPSYHSSVTSKMKNGFPVRILERF